MIETWLLLALLAALLHGLVAIVHRHVLHGKGADWQGYTFGYHIISTLFFIPLLFTEWSPPTAWEPWGLALFASLVWAASALTAFKSIRFAEVSLRTPINRSKLIWSVLFAALLLGEALTGAKVAGVLLIFLGVVLVSLKTGGRLGGLEDPGVRLTLLSAFLTGFVLVVDKTAIAFFPASLYGFLMYLLPAFWLALAIPQRLDKFFQLVKGPLGTWLVLAAVMDAAYYWLLISALKIADASLVAPIVEFNVAIAAIGGILLLGERKDLVRRLVGLAITFLGVYVLGS
jgi:uncharacterized membrane protein